jgi:hypothetical protein
VEAASIELKLADPVADTVYVPDICAKAPTLETKIREMNKSVLVKLFILRCLG